MRSKMPSDLNALSAADSSLKLKGLAKLKVYGRELTFKPMKISHVGNYLARFMILQGTHQAVKASRRKAVENAIVKWDGLTYEDLWRDPEVGFRVIREIANAA